MRVTIVVPDNRVSVDGDSLPVDCSALAAEGKHAVQWQDTFGEVEFKTIFDPETQTVSRQPNEMITDISPYQSYIDAWEVEKAKQPQPDIFTPYDTGKTIAQRLGAT